MRDNKDVLSCDQWLSCDPISRSWIRTWSTFESLVNKVHHFFHQVLIVRRRSFDFPSACPAGQLRYACPLRSLALLHEILFELQNYTQPISHAICVERKWGQLFIRNQCNVPPFALHNWTISSQITCTYTRQWFITLVMADPNLISIQALVFAGPRQLKSGFCCTLDLGV